MVGALRWAPSIFAVVTSAIKPSKVMGPSTTHTNRSVQRLSVLRTIRSYTYRPNFYNLSKDTVAKIVNG